MNKISKKYKDSLSKKTVQELVEIIIRKDDKDKIKSKNIKLLENKIVILKQQRSELENQFKSLDVSYKLAFQRGEKYRSDAIRLKEYITKLKRRVIVLLSVLMIVIILNFFMII